MDELSKENLSHAIARASKYTIRALKRNDDAAAFNSLKALVHMQIRMQNFRKALDVAQAAKELFPDF